MKHLLQQLLRNVPLTAEQAESAFSDIIDGTADPLQTASLLTLLAAREPSVDVLAGAATIMRRHAVAIDAPDNVIDTCGTGGTSSSFFNISTAAALVAAACGAPVAKHGNRSITSRSGSSDVLKALGVNIDATPEQEAACLKHAHICFAFAPRHHPAMKNVAGIRQALGFPTIFNLVAPLANPAGAKRQLVGTRTPELADKILQVLIRLGAQRSLVVCGLDPEHGPLCDISITGPTHIATFNLHAPHVPAYTLKPESLGLPTHASAADLVIHTPEESAEKIKAILAGQSGPARDIVLANAAAALWVAGIAPSIAAGVPRAAAAVDSGQAAETLKKLIARSHGAPIEE